MAGNTFKRANGVHKTVQDFCLKSGNFIGVGGGGGGGAQCNI